MAENWYMILELEFDPNPVEDINVINQRIDEKAKFWSSKFNDYKKGPEYRKYHQMIPEIREILADDEERKKQIKEACGLTYGPIDNFLNMIGRKGEVTEEEIRRFSIKRKIAVEIIRKRAVALGIKLALRGIDYQSIYDKYYQSPPKNAAAYDGSKQLLSSFNVTNLYEFLYIDSTYEHAHYLDCKTLRRQAGSLKKNKYYKNDSVSGSGSKLCGQCELTFKDNNSKALYDNYLAYHKRKAVLDQVKEIFDISDELHIEQMKRFIEQLTEIIRDRKLAGDILTAFCKIEKIPMPVLFQGGKPITPITNIKVCRCGCMNDIADGRRVCKSCGLELVIKCPGCGENNDANIKVCKCGFHFEDIDRVMALCEIAQDAIDAMDFTVAREYLQDAGRYWPGSSKVLELNRRITRLENRIGKTARLMRKACESKSYCEAKKHYETIQKLSPNYTRKDLKAEMDNAIGKAHLLVKQARCSTDEEAIVYCCVMAYETCKDYPGVREILSGYPLQKADELKISVDSIARTNILSWTQSNKKGLVYYIVIKKIGAVPANISDGTLVGRVSMCSVMDNNIIPGEHYYYSVFTERAGVYSAPLLSMDPVVNLFEISGVTITAGDGLVQINWDQVPSGAKVKIYHIKGNGIEEELYCTNNQSFLDKDLINDQAYTYRVCLEYQVVGRGASTEGIVVTGIPTKIVVRSSKEEVVKINMVTLANEKIYISVNLPKGATGFVVLYRFEQYATGISDLKTIRKYMPLKQGRRDGLLMIDSTQPKTYYFSIFAEFIRDGEKEYSVGYNYLFNNLEKAIITYSIHITKKLFGKKSVILKFESEYEDFLLPDIDIVSAVGVIPMFKDLAANFYSIPSREVSGRVKVKIPLPRGLARGTFIKAFLKDESLYKCYQLRLKWKSNYRIS